MRNFLIDSLVPVERNDSAIDTMALPQILAVLMDDDVVAFPALRPHQRHAWHAFLVQLGVMAILKAELSQPPTDSDEWLGILRNLTRDEHPNDEPWHLVNDDITMPAFLQPPASSEDKLADYKTVVNTPDELDMLVTSKNHDLKSSVSTQGDIDGWLFALNALQTMEGFSGAGNYGISRMNGGLGNRPTFTLAPAANNGMNVRMGQHIKRDIEALLEYRDTLVSDYPMTDSGVGLLWTQPWDGIASQKLLLNALNPFYIEIGRRVRLRANENGNLYAIRATSKAARIESKAMNGRTGDPWTPINMKEGKSLTLGAGGFTYKRIVDYLTGGDWEWPALLNSTPSDPDDMALVARAMVRGQGKTEGYYERIIPISDKFKSAMMRRASAQELGDIAKERIADVGKVQRVLRHAVSVFAAGGGDSISDEHRSRANPWANRLDDIVDTTFFDDLQNEFEADESERQAIRNKWRLNGIIGNGVIDENGDGVINCAKRILHDAEDALPCNEIRRYKARTRAESAFEGMIRSNSRGFPDLF